ncbi:MAG: YscO family type III secretion system apparatus protein [Victivallales bacterium]|nr:YscO family type III secretion system apparatus protein [Victivallales bacterium]
MAYALQSMLRIRTMREDRASAELSAARQEVRRAEQNLEESKETLRQFEATKEERRDRIYATVIGHAVSREAIDRMLEGVARIDEEGALKADNVNLAIGKLKERQEAAEKARVGFIKASKERMKISEHKAVWLAEEAKDQEHRQEIELEDFTGKKNTENADGPGS